MTTNYVYDNNTKNNPEWGIVLDPVPRGRPQRNGVNTDRERLIVEAVKLLKAERHEKPDQVINGAIHAIERSALNLGGMVPYYLRDVAKRETSVNRLIREVVLRAASPKNRRQALSADAIQKAYLSASNSVAGQGRETRAAERTLDRRPTKTLSGSQKTQFFGLPTGEVHEKTPLPADNMGVENYFGCKNRVNHDKTIPGWLGSREAVPGIFEQGCDNNTYRKHYLLYHPLLDFAR